MRLQEGPGAPQQVGSRARTSPALVLLSPSLCCCSLTGIKAVPCLSRPQQALVLLVLTVLPSPPAPPTSLPQNPVLPGETMRGCCLVHAAWSTARALLLFPSRVDPHGCPWSPGPGLWGEAHIACPSSPLSRSCMQLGRTAWEQMSPSSTQFCAPGAGPTWWQVRRSQASLGPGR